MSFKEALAGADRNFAMREVCDKAKKAAKDRDECMIVYFNDENMPELNTESWVASAEGCAYTDPDKLFIRFYPDGEMEYL